MSREPGSLLADKYRLVRSLGEGSTGTVWEAENTLVSRRVAIKILDPARAGDPETRRRFLEEARAGGRIGHPNVVDVFDLGEAEGRTPFMVMELCDGETLDAILRSRGAVGIGYACELLCQILSALEAAHGLGIIHRDLKPANVMVVHPQPDQPVAKVLDFGIATSVHAADPGGGIFGTPNYMAPEQAAGGPIDHRADIYAAAAILYELLSGRPPFIGDMPSLVLADVLTRPPMPLRAYDKSIPRDLEAIVKRTLAKDPDERPATARALKKELLAFVPKLRSSSAPPPATLSEAPLPLISQRSPKLPTDAPAPASKRPTLELVVEPSVPPPPMSRKRG